MALTYELLSYDVAVYRGGTFDTIYALAADAFPRIKDLGSDVDMDQISRSCHPGHTYHLGDGEQSSDIAIAIREL